MKPRAGVDRGNTVVFCRGCPAQANAGGEPCCTLTVWFCAFGDRLRAAADGFTVCVIDAFVLSNPKKAVLKNQTDPRRMSCPAKLNVGLVTLAANAFCVVLALKLNVGLVTLAVSVFCSVLALKLNVGLVTLAVSAFCIVLALKLKEAADRSIVVAPEGVT